MSDSKLPQMSVIIITPDHYNKLSKTIEHLRAQTARDKLEIVIVAPSIKDFDQDGSYMRDFLRFHMVEVGEFKSIGEAVAAGVRMASAPVVTYVEEHAYPEPDWAECLIKAHQQFWAAVGAVLYNANSESLISWTSFFTDFGPWVEQASGIELRGLASHQTSYKRSILLDYGTELGSMLEVETILHWDLISKGYRLYLEPGAKIHHLNISLLPSLIVAQFLGGRIFGAARISYEHWSLWRRLLYIGGMPLIPIIRFKRVLKEILRTTFKTNLIPSILPAIIVVIVSHSIGEWAGYVFGVGDSPKRILNFELNRSQYVKGPRNE
jgi:GT2 family glycosyltransferase